MPVVVEVAEVARAVVAILGQRVARRLRLALSSPPSRQGPRAVMLFVGPSGVGKTETARLLAEHLFGSAAGMIRMDMSELREEQAVARLLALVEKGAFADAVFDEVTGAAFARTTPKPAVRVDAEGTRRAWRGTISFADSGAVRFHTGNDTATAVGRVVEGMEAVDALDAMDRIKSAEILR